jgi:hypothetical protein
MRLNTLDVSVTSTIQEEVSIVDEFSSQVHTYEVSISLSSNKKRADVFMVPRYYLDKWRLNCELDRNQRQSDNEFDLMICKAKKKPNRWVEIDAGSYRSVSLLNFPKGMNDNYPRSFRMQPFGENTCVFNSLINAMHYITDYRARDELLSYLPQSINVEEFGKEASTRRSHAAYICNFKIKGYFIEKRRNFDILQYHSFWPTLCILQGSDKSTTHAITVVENYIFESNCPHAIMLTKENLDWCCSSEFSPNVKYVQVVESYHFRRAHPHCNLLL